MFAKSFAKSTTISITTLKNDSVSGRVLNSWDLLKFIDSIILRLVEIGTFDSLTVLNGKDGANPEYQLTVVIDFQVRFVQSGGRQRSYRSLLKFEHDF